MELVARNTVIMFEPVLADEFRRFSAHVNEVTPSKILLNEKDQLPHLTVYQTVFPAASEEAAMKALEELAEQLEPISITINAKRLKADFIFLDAINGEPLQRLHERIIDALNDARAGCFDESALNFPGLTDDQRHNLLSTGMLFSRNYYRPHVTVARLENIDDGPKALAALPDILYYPAEVTAIHFVETGPNGTCRKVLRTFMLEATA